MLPEIVKDFLLTHKEGRNCLCLAINQKHHIIQYFGSAHRLGVQPPQFEMPVSDYLPILQTETFESNFEIPFYNTSENSVCTIYFIKQKSISFVVMVDKSEIFRVTQKYQQFAHEDNISKNKFKRLAQELEVAKQELKKSDREKATLIAMLSHELGTPLTSILGYSELLLRNEINNKKGLEVIHKSANHLKHLIENTLIFGRSEAQGLQIQLNEISIQSLFNEIKATLLSMAQNKGINLQMFHKGADIVTIDVTRTKQILINLLNNAIKYTESGTVELKFSIIKNNCVFSVIDTGLGISKDLQKTIFDPWQRIEENSESGSGIGLFISQKLAKAMGGKLKLKYSSKEFGSIFQLLIPVQRSRTKQTLKDPKAYLPCNNKSILVIDDDQDILDLIAAMLQPCHLKIHTAIDAEAAFKLLSKTKVDIILTDYNLGSVKASSLVTRFKKLDIPLLLMSALPSETNKQKYIQQGFDAIINKPLNSQNLQKTITNSLSQSKSLLN